MSLTTLFMQLVSTWMIMQRKMEMQQGKILKISFFSLKNVFPLKTTFLFRLLMTEAYATVEQQTRWYGEGEKRGSHIPFNFAFIADITKTSKAKNFKDAVDEWMKNMPSFAMGQANWVLGNHDRPRIRSRFGDERYESLAIMSMMLPGVTIVYYVS